MHLRHRHLQIGPRETPGAETHPSQPYTRIFPQSTLSSSVPKGQTKQRPMVLKIRLARFGKRNSPFYNIVVAQARTARNSKPLEVLGPCSLFLLLPHNPTHSKDPLQHIPPTHTTSQVNLI